MKSVGAAASGIARSDTVRDVGREAAKGAANGGASALAEAGVQKLTNPGGGGGQGHGGKPDQI